MKSLACIPHLLLLLLAAAGSGTAARAQLPQCLGDGGFVYIIDHTTIWNWDPALPLGPANPVVNTITVPGGSGLAVSTNLNSAGPSPTFYATVGGTYWYYSDTGWINTGHSTGNPGAVNPGAGGGYIFNLVGATGQVYRYDGTGPSILLTTITDFQGGGPYDLQADSAGNFYLLKGTTGGSGQWMRKYSPNGVLLQQWTLSGVANLGAGPGFAITGNSVYFYDNTNYYVGTVDSANVAFTVGTPPVVTGEDWGSCPSSVLRGDSAEYPNPLSIGPAFPAPAALSIYPNPNQGKFVIDLAVGKGTYVRTDVYAASGMKVYSLWEKSDASGRYLREISLPDEPAGMYYLRVVSDDRAHSGKVMVLK